MAFSRGHVKYIWRFRRLSFTPCPRRDKDPHETVEEFVTSRKDSFEGASRPFAGICRFCKHLMPEEGKWSVTIDAQD
jgi:hypothetical protein